MDTNPRPVERIDTAAIGRLTPAGVKILKDKQSRGNRAAFFAFAHARGLVFTTHWWRRLKDGSPVPQQLIACWFEYMRDRDRIPRSSGLSDWMIRLDPAGGRARLTEQDVGRFNFWGDGGWQTLVKFLVDLFLGRADVFLHQEALLQDEAEVFEAARMAMEAHGRALLDRNRLSPEEAIDASSRMARMSPREYGAWMAAFWRRDPLTVLYATVPDKADPTGLRKVVGATMNVPLTDTAYARLRDGRASFLDLTAADYQRPSRRILVQSVCEVSPSKCPASNQQHFAQGHCVLYQWASFLPLLESLSGADGPTLITQDVGPKNTRRAKGYGFRPNGATMPRQNAPVLEIRSPQAWPTRPGLRDRISYRAMCAVIGMYQEALAEDGEDDAGE